MALTYLALGDSYTIGESVEPHERWPVQLTQRLNDHGIETESAEILAQTGWTTDELDQAMDARSFTRSFDVVTLLIGVNNQYRGRSVTEFGQQFDRILERCFSLSKTGISGIWVLSIPDWGCTPFAKDRDRDCIRQEIDDFNRETRDRCRQAQAAWVDITDLTRRASNDSRLTAIDGLHPSAELYSLWVDRLYPLVQKSLEVKSPPFAADTPHADNVSRPRS
jgi:lysophospholipase L1-like esterase